MPASRARASFEPLPPDFDLTALVESNDRFCYVDRISCDKIDEEGLENFEKLVLLHVVKRGKPLVIDGYQQRLDEWTFSSKWLQDNHGDKIEYARNLTKKEPLELTVGHYVRNMDRLADQFFDAPDNYLDKNRQRIYMKDIDCPPVWIDKLREHIPPNVFYLNESTGEIGGPGSSEENKPGIGRRKGRGIAPAGDLMSSLPQAMRAENLMCYIGHEGTYTPSHREMCASLGHNIMVESSGGVGADGKPEKPGSSIWFMTETNDRQLVSEYWLSVLGHDIETENHFAQVAAWKKAPFKVYVLEQRAGDFLIIPPLAPHQVWNRGTRTMKVAWNRTTVDTLELAINEALPRARQVCRDEQYKNKAIVFFTLQKYHTLISKTFDFMRTARSPEEQRNLMMSPKIITLQKDFKRLFNMFKGIMLSEMFAPENPTERNMNFLPFDSNVTCAYCRGNIFNRFLTCGNCDDLLGTVEPEPYDVCMECYAMGRSCGCISKLKWAEQWKWKDLSSKYETWRRLYVELDQGVVTETSPRPLAEERARFRKNTLAQICQGQLKRRPFIDVHKNQPEEDLEDSGDDEQVEIGEDGTVKRKKKKRSESWLKNHSRCHVCQHRHPRWRMAECACGRHWCYGSLFRGHDLMPQEIMEKPGWRCPHCEGICSAGGCKRDPRQKPYEPKGTLLGHDTRAVADVRSVESLVDFSVSNLNWLKEDAESQSKRLQARQHEADRAREDRDDVDPADGSPADDTLDPTLARLSQLATDSIDPALGGGEIRRELVSVDPYADYAPAHQSGFVAPAAVMFGQADAEHEIDDSLYDDQDNSAMLNALGKHGRDDDEEITRDAPVKRAKYDRTLTSMNKSLSGASKQYRKDHERRALEVARRKGRYLQTSAALRGKSLVVKWKLGSDRLRGLLKDLDAPDEDEDLLRSDVVHAHHKTAPKPTAKSAASKVRLRERDQSFSTRKGREKPIDQESELSDFDPEEDFGQTSHHSGALEKNEAGDRRRRISSWQQKRAAEESELFFPENGSPAESPARPNATRRVAGKTTSIRPSVHFSISSDEDEDTPARSMAQLDGAGDSPDEDEAVKPVATNGASKTAPPRSIFSKASRGRKIKIVSANRRHTLGPGGVSSSKVITAGFTAANKTP